MADQVRTTVRIAVQLALAAKEAAERENASRATVLWRWLLRGYEAVQADRLLVAYDEYYAEPDGDAPPAEVRRRRAAAFDAGSG